MFKYLSFFLIFSSSLSFGAFGQPVVTSGIENKKNLLNEIKKHDELIKSNSSELKELAKVNEGLSFVLQAYGDKKEAALNGTLIESFKDKKIQRDGKTIIFEIPKPNEESLYQAFLHDAQFILGHLEN